MILRLLCRTKLYLSCCIPLILARRRRWLFVFLGQTSARPNHCWDTHEKRPFLSENSRSVVPRAAGGRHRHCRLYTSTFVLRRTQRRGLVRLGALVVGVHAFLNPSACIGGEERGMRNHFSLPSKHATRKRGREQPPHTHPHPSCR